MNRRQFLGTASAAAVSAAMPAEAGPFVGVDMASGPDISASLIDNLEWWPMPFSRASWLWANGIRPMRGAERNFYTRLAFSADYPQPKLERISYLARLLDFPAPSEEPAE